MGATYGSHLSIFACLLDKFESHAEFVHHRIFLILAILNHENPFKQSLINESPCAETVKLFFTVLSGLFCVDDLLLLCPLASCNYKNSYVPWRDNHSQEWARCACFGAVEATSKVSIYTQV
jgi:hypothetical protein